MQLRRAPDSPDGTQARERRPPVGTRGSAKPAPMMSGPANVSAAPPLHAGGERADPIMWVFPGGGRHRCAERSESRLLRSCPDDTERRGSGRKASHSGTRGPSLPPAFGGLCRPEVGVPLPARRSAEWRGCRDLHHPGTALSCGRGERADPIMWVFPGGGPHRWRDPGGQRYAGLTTSSTNRRRRLAEPGVWGVMARSSSMDLAPVSLR